MAFLRHSSNMWGHGINEMVAFYVLKNMYIKCNSLFTCSFFSIIVTNKHTYTHPNIAQFHICSTSWIIIPVIQTHYSRKYINGPRERENKNKNLENDIKSNWYPGLFKVKGCFKVTTSDKLNLKGFNILDLLKYPKIICYDSSFPFTL